MEKTRYQQGLDIINEITLTDNKEIGTHTDIVAAFKDLAPDLENYIVEFAFGDIYSREGITQQQTNDCHNRFSCNSRYRATIGIAYQRRSYNWINSKRNCWNCRALDSLYRLPTCLECSKDSKKSFCSKKCES